MRLLIADDHGIVRGGLKLLIDRQPDMEVVAEAEDGVDAFEQALQSRPDLCVMDVSMPRMTGLQAARQIRAHLPETQVLALSMHDDERYVFDALKAGASRVDVELNTVGRTVLRVRDDGKGFESRNGRGRNRLGVSGMRDRVELVRYAIRRGLTEA